MSTSLSTPVVSGAAPGVGITDLSASHATDIATRAAARTSAASGTARGACRAALAGLALALAGLALALAGCSAGPDFARPAAPAVGAYDNAQAPPAAWPSVSPVAYGQALPAEWWQLFRAPALPDLLQQVIAASPTLEAARAALAQARESIVQARAGWHPTVAAGASGNRSIYSNPGTPDLTSYSNGAFNQFSLGPTISYTFDVAGQTRRTVEQATANAENQRYQLAAAYLTLTSAAATQAITLALNQKLLSITEGLIRNDERNLALVRRAFDAGASARTDVLTAQAQLENDRTQLPALHQQVSVARHALALLAGQAPAQWSTPAFDLDGFQMPAALPVSLPAELVRQRPDILSAEALLHADSAAIGIAEAQLYPSLTLSLSASYSAATLGAVFSNAGKLYSATADGNWVLFQGGALEAQKRVAVAAWRAQAATYRQTVLTAFAQVADALRAIDNDIEALRLAQSALAISTESLRLQRASFSAGKSNVLQMIVAENAYAQASMNLARVHGQRLLDCVALFAALGGGWERAPAFGARADQPG